MKLIISVSATAIEEMEYEMPDNLTEKVKQLIREEKWEEIQSLADWEGTLNDSSIVYVYDEEPIKAMID